MARKTCNKGHIYDPAIYGDNCPFCPSAKSTEVIDNNIGGGTFPGVSGYMDGTEVNQDGGGRTAPIGGTAAIPTVPLGGGGHGGGGFGGGTVIRPASGEVTGITTGRKIVGMLVTYSTTPYGQIFNICEGRNNVGRDANNDICITGDSQVSSRHFSILYRVADGRFKFKDEQSSNGTFLNEVITDEGELSTFDIIRVGSTKLIFVAIPQIS